MTAARVAADLIAAIESRDLRAIERRITSACTWQNVPEEPVVGSDAVLAMLGGILGWSDEVRWDVVSSAERAGAVHLERIDRFWLDGEECAVSCHGVFEIDAATERVASVRDYVDLAAWRARVGPVYRRLAARPAVDVVRRHLDAVRRGDVVGMVADYALDAVLTRGGDVHAGWRALGDYFGSVPSRLGGGEVRFGRVEGDVTSPWSATVRWEVVGEGRLRAAGRDRFDVRDGRITAQEVALDGQDF